MSDHDDVPYVVIEKKSGGASAFLIGAIVGAGLALLFAPRSGRETREELKAGVARMRDRANDTVRGLQETMTDTLDSVRDEVNDRIDSAREAFEAGRQAARDTRRQMEHKVQDARARVRAGIDAARQPPPQERDARSPAREPRANESDSETEFGA
jgi:gas vesicle protein